jgi:DNA repair photolyase
MARRTEFVLYRPKTILNKGKRADHWFWTRYSAYPYKGCQHKCLFWYCRERKYCPFEDLNDFGYVIQVKENAADLLRRALSRVPVDVVATGDYQPAEKKFEVSRRMLEVCLALGFPVSVLERSPLVLRDLDLIKEINQRAPSVIFFSMISAPDSPAYERVREMENLAPKMERRYAAMEQIARAGILTGISMMPILPGLCDTDENLEATIRCTAEHGGQFVVAGGLTLADQQRDYFFGALRDRFPDLLPLYERIYPAGSYSAVRSGDPYTIGRRIRELCRQYGISDRMPRPIIPGDKRALNKRIVEALANECYWMELDNVPQQRVWAYRRAAWAIEDTEQDLGLIYRAMGRKGLESIENVGPKLALVVEQFLKAALWLSENEVQKTLQNPCRQAPDGVGTKVPKQHVVAVPPVFELLNTEVGRIAQEGKGDLDDCFDLGGSEPVGKRRGDDANEGGHGKAGD